jgi:AraC family transcriptional regulator
LCSLSQWHFARAFKASTGLSPYQWQLDVRLKQAQDLLLTTDGTIEIIAQATGFVDAMHFNRLFKKKTGGTPSSWRRARLATAHSNEKLLLSEQ